MSSSLVQLTLARLRLFFREPGAVFWSFGFPLLLTVALGIAFRNRPPDPINVGVVESAQAQTVYDALKSRSDIHAHLMPSEEAKNALRTGKVAILVNAADRVVYTFDQMRPESRLARSVVDDVLQRAAGRHDARAVSEQIVSEPGARYIDFLIPGLIGMNLMSAGMWGIGFVIVEMRTRKLLKRMAATPMKRSDFLLSFILTRLAFVLIELPVILIFAYFAFDVTVRGSLALFTGLSFLGAFTFAGLGMLVASRAQNTQTVGGLMNLVMMPMFICSGVFFSSANFPDAVQPLIKILPLTALNDSLRAVMNEGAGPSAVAVPALILTVFAVLSFGAALRVFRWQ